MLLKSILLVLIALSISGCVYYVGSDREPQPVKDYTSDNYPAQTLNYRPPPTPIPTEIYGDLLIDNISRDLNGFHERGWRNLYEKGEFDCSRMTTYFWDYIRNKYKVPPKIVTAPNRNHAWLALKVNDTGDTNRYLRWTIKGVQYYFIETTVPQVVIYEKNISFGNPPVYYDSSNDFYTTEISLSDDPTEANIDAGRWFNEFRLTKPDLDKLDSFKSGK